MLLLQRSNGRPSLLYPYHIFPLRVLKQIVAMFLSVNVPGFGRRNQELVKFVLNRHTQYLPPRYRFFTYYNLSPRLRLHGLTVKSNIFTRESTIMSEISFPPFGYLMTVDSSPPDSRLAEVSHFSRFQYDEQRTLYLQFPFLPVVSPLPGDYRSVDEIRPSFSD